MQLNVNQNQINEAVKTIVSAKLMTQEMNADEIVDFTLMIMSGLSAKLSVEAEAQEKNFKGARNANNPAVPVEDSIQPDYLICLEDGQRFKMMKRHLREAYDMSPDEYRNKWGLGTDYPMAAPNYSAKKAGIAKSLGLGLYERK